MFFLLSLMLQDLNSKIKPHSVHHVSFLNHSFSSWLLSSLLNNKCIECADFQVFSHIRGTFPSLSIVRPAWDFFLSLWSCKRRVPANEIKVLIWHAVTAHMCCFAVVMVYPAGKQSMEMGAFMKVQPTVL